MSDKPKTFEEWLDERIQVGSQIHIRREFFDAFEYVKNKETWNARDALAKEQIETTRQEMQAEIDKLKNCLGKYSTLHDSIELLARNIVDQCVSYEDLTQCTPIQLTREHREYIHAICDAYDLIESNPAGELLRELTQEKDKKK